MINELVFFSIALLDFTFILLIARLGKSWLNGAIVLNILLISTFGAKLVPIFDFITNSGNVFYAAVFFTTQLLVERYGKKEGYKSIVLGVCSIIIFILMGQLIIAAIGSDQTYPVNRAIETLFAAAPRIALASLLGYIFSQLVNIWLFDFLRKKTGGNILYLRVNLSNLVGQLVDSLFFFTIAFYGTMSTENLFQTLFAGFLLKVLAGILSTPFFYASFLFNGKKDCTPGENEYTHASVPFSFSEWHIQLIIIVTSTLPLLLIVVLFSGLRSSLAIPSLFVLCTNVILAGIIAASLSSLRKSQKTAFTVMTDLKSEKARAEILARDLQKFKLAVDGASDHIVMTDTDGTILYANAAMTKLTGFAHEEVIGKKAGSQDLWGGLMSREFYEKLWQTVKVEKNVFTGELKNKRKDGKEYVTAATIYPICDTSGNAAFFVEIHRDITREKEIEQFKDDFVSMASHGLKTPLAAIDSILSMIEDGDFGPVGKPLKGALHTIGNSSERLLHLVNNMLHAGRIEQGRLSVDLQTVSLNTILESIIQSLTPIVQAKGLELTCDATQPLIVSADPELTKEILSNLIGNALKFTQKGSVSITGSAEGELASLVVTDTGVGIPREAESRLFQKFAQLTGTYEGRPAGSGLGLYISREFARSMGGDVRMVRSVVGKGSTFTLTLPLANT